MTSPQTSGSGSATFRLVLVRHGESTWNRSLRLTGWEDPPLSAHGRAQARQAGADLRARGLAFDVCYSSLLRRTTETRDLLLAALDAAPRLHESWRLNERHYGALQGLRTWQAVLRYGPSAVRRCTRELDGRPPQVAAARELAPPPYVAAADVEDWRTAQRGESLADTLRRLLPLWEHDIAPAIRGGERVLVVAHNNLLRGLVHHLDGGSGRPGPRLPTARPLLLELNRDLRIVEREGM